MGGKDNVSELFSGHKHLQNHVHRRSLLVSNVQQSQSVSRYHPAEEEVHNQKRPAQVGPLTTPTNASQATNKNDSKSKQTREEKTGRKK
jgi:hypothetical protein